MKRIVSLLSAIVIGLSAWLSTFWYSAPFNTVHNWMYSNWLTKYDNVTDFRPNDRVTRWEISKFISQYAGFMWFEPNYTQCNFDDISNYDSTLVPHIKSACSYWLIKWSWTKFMPTGNLTEAQAITIVVRSLYWFLDETGSRRRGPYYEAGKQLWIIQNESIDWVNATNITRQKVWTRFYIAATMVTDQDLIWLDGEEDIRRVLKEIFWNIQL